jgi:hypothetical protein
LKTVVKIFAFCLLFVIGVNSRQSLHAASSGAYSNSRIDSLYEQLDLQKDGLSKQAFAFAYKGFRRLVQSHIIDNNDYLVICDFSQSSKKKRLYVVDLSSGTVLLTSFVAHGRRSGGEFATRFSNRPESQQSSLGFYISKETYFGEHGLSLRLAGLEKGINDKAMRRNIVIHGADYIGESWLRRGSMMGRSYGCPALPRKESDRIIETIKKGSCIFIYYPSLKYLNESKILND